MKLIIALLLVASLAHAEEKKVDVVATSVPDAAQNALLKAGHVADKATTEMKSIQVEWLTFVSQANERSKDIQDRVAKAAKAAENAEKAYQAEVDKAASAIGLDPKKYSFDREKLTFAPLASPAPGIPSPEKK